MRTTIAVAVIMFGVVVGVNIVNAAIPLPQDPSSDTPGVQPIASVDPGQPVGPAPTMDPGTNPGPAASTTPLEPGPVTPGTSVDIGGNFSLVMPKGWSIADNSDGWMIFTKGSAVVAVGNIPYNGTPLELLTAYKDQFFTEGNLTADDPSSGTIGNAIPIAGLNYTGTLKASATVDGFIIAAAENGKGMVINAFAPTGKLSAMSDDLDAILKSIKRAGE